MKKEIELQVSYKVVFYPFFNIEPQRLKANILEIQSIV